MAKSLLQKFLEDSDHECQSYSGRGAFGAFCLSTVTDATAGSLAADLMRQVAIWANTSESLTAIDEMISQFSSLRTDKMGTKNVFYFPAVQYSES